MKNSVTTDINNFDYYKDEFDKKVLKWVSNEIKDLNYKD